MDFKKLWNNRIFRTFLQAMVGGICGAITENKSIAVIVVIGVSTGLAAIIPLIDEEKLRGLIRQRLTLSKSGKDYIFTAIRMRFRCGQLVGV